VLELRLINEFRGVVNENSFTYFRYSNNRDKNQWNCICSAMDWITVAVEHLAGYPRKRVRDLGSIEMYSYIASVDIIVEAVQQLHRVIFSTSEQLFSKDTDCFPQNKFNKNDLDYFKTIRSCFGAHPVNLDEPGKEQDRSMRRFASWSGGNFGGGDFSVILYSNQIGGNDIFLSIDMKQVLTFVQKYYSYLQVLILELKRQYVTFCAEMKSKRFCYSGDVLSRLHTLRTECKARLNNDYYRTTIDELILIFKTPITCKSNREMVEAYCIALESLIDEIYHNLQEMNLVDLEYDDLLYPMSDKLPNGWGYWREKLSEHVFGNGYPPEVWIDRIENIFGDLFEFTYSNYNELFVLVQASVYRLSLDKKE